MPLPSPVHYMRMVMRGTSFTHQPKSVPRYKMAENKCCRGGCCGELDEETHPTSIRMMRIFGVLAVIFSVVEFGLGGAATGILVNPEVYVGSWWVGLLSIAVGICGIIAKSRGGVITIIILGSIAMLTAVAGAIIDSSTLTKLSYLESCQFIPARRTVTYRDVDCDLLSGASEPEVRCFCKRSKYNSNCIIYNPKKKSNDTCDEILVTLPSLLKSSVAVCSVIAFCSIVLAAVGCSIVCCTGTAKKEIATKPEELPDNKILGVDSNSKAY